MNRRNFLKATTALVGGAAIGLPEAAEDIDVLVTAMVRDDLLDAIAGGLDEAMLMRASVSSVFIVPRKYYA